MEKTMEVEHLRKDAGKLLADTVAVDLVLGEELEVIGSAAVNELHSHDTLVDILDLGDVDRGLAVVCKVVVGPTGVLSLVPKVHLERHVLVHLLGKPLEAEFWEYLLDPLDKDSGGLHVDLREALHIWVHHLDGKLLSRFSVARAVYLGERSDSDGLGVDFAECLIKGHSSLGAEHGLEFV